MERQNEIKDVLQVIRIVLVVATFLLNTGRAHQVIELCKECLIFLNKERLKKENQFVNLRKIFIYQRMFKAYCLLPDYTTAIKCGRNLLAICRNCGETAKEGYTTIALADIYKKQCRYTEARELYERAINIMKGIDDREREAYAYGQFGTMSYRLGQFFKAKEYFGKALAITTDIGHTAGKATSFENLGTVLFSLGEYDKAKEHHEKALAINITIGDRAGVATSY